MAVVSPAVLAIAFGHQAAHDLRSPAKDADRIAAADRLADRAEIGRDSEILLCAAGTHSEGAQHFVEDQQRAMIGCQPPHRRNKLARSAAHSRRCSTRLHRSRPQSHRRGGRRLARANRGDCTESESSVDRVLASRPSRSEPTAARSGQVHPPPPTSPGRDSRGNFPRSGRAWSGR